MAASDSGRDHQAAVQIWSHWIGARAMSELPEDCRPRSLSDGYAAQAHLPQAADSDHVGWKIAATSKAGQRHLDVEGPIAGRLLASRVLGHPAHVPMGGNRMRVAEGEFAFALGRDLPPREAPYTEAEVLEAVARLHPAIEIPDSRFTDFTAVGAAQLAADNACANWLVLGRAVSVDWRARDLSAQRVVVRIDGDFAGEGHGRDVLGGPLTALAWIANNHALQGCGLEAGQVITTGVCGLPVPIGDGEKIVADFGEFGLVEVTMV